MRKLIAVLVFLIDTDFIMKDRVKANIAKFCDLLYLSKIFAVAVAKR